ncbi:MAG: 50S ribosomal protein L37ae [Candidatus Woesearchaeota archaeon]
MVSSSSSTKRFGSRYGKTVKSKFGAVEALQKKAYVCPSCSRESVKRTSMGIWQCKKCGHKFAGKAYTVSKVQKIQTKTTEL